METLATLLVKLNGELASALIFVAKSALPMRELVEPESNA